MQSSRAMLRGGLALLLLGMTGIVYAQSPNPSSPDFFETKIRPIFADNCYSCHTDSESGGLRLDSQAAALKGGEHGPALVPGDPDKSLLITAVRQTTKLKMPLGGKLSDAQVAELEAWVKAGAVWPKATAKPGAEKYEISEERRKFWSFVPLKAPKPPQVKDAKWAKNDIDRFVLAKLEEKGMKPVAPASKRDLIRRAYLDVIGLPPTPEQIAAFEKDTSPQAFSKVVDHLLASPQYGERWGRIWLDVARYGEDDYRSLNPNPRGYYPYKNAYLYRDWVIQALNDDMPYDTFVKAQLAGDLMDPKVRYKMLPATGFLGLGPWYFDNGAVAITRADERNDRVDVIGRGLLGLTVGCARCHNHKYDPIPQTDYYSLAGVFRDTDYHEYATVPQSVVEKYLKQQDDIENEQDALTEMQNNLASQLAESLALKTSTYLQAAWEVTGPDQKTKEAVVDEHKLDYELLDRWITYMGKTTARYHEKDAWQAMMKKGGGNAREAKRLADQFQKEILDVMLRRRTIDEEDDVIRAKAIGLKKNLKRRDKPNLFKTDEDFCPGCSLNLKNLPEADNSFWTEIFQRSLDESSDADAGGRRGNPGVLLFRGWGLESRIGAGEEAQITALKKDLDAKRKASQPYPFIHGVEDIAHPVDLELALRGNPNNLGPKIPRHFLSVFSEGDPKPFTQGSGRLELANDIVKQPIAMRVFVNRVWREHFGTGIVETTSNFGQAGERPTDPELLEYLASYFVQNGMSIKKLQRLIMLSATYQLSTENNPENAIKDSGNRLYWRANRRRMDAEQLRDSVLFVSGNLDPAMGGPSEDLTPGDTRRTVYGRVSRYRLDTYLQTFDFPTPSMSAAKRFTTTTPLQRLFLMNSDFMQIEAEDLAKRTALEPTSEARIQKLYQLAYGREPSQEEIQLGLSYLRAEPMREYQEDKAKSHSGKDGKAHRAPGEAPVSGLSDGATLKTVAFTPGGDAAAADPAPNPEAAAGGGDNSDMGTGMMSGVPGFKKNAKKTVKYEPTPWGRYAKVLLSSSEFIFIN